MNEQIITIVTALISAGGLTAIIQYFLNRPKTNAEARKLDVEADELLFQRYEKIVAQHEARIKQLLDERDAWMNEKGKMVDEMQKLRLSHERLEQTLTSIAAMLGEVLDEETRVSEPFRSILSKINDLRKT